jgi:hypothetical protein
MFKEVVPGNRILNGSCHEGSLVGYARLGEVSACRSCVAVPNMSGLLISTLRNDTYTSHSQQLHPHKTHWGGAHPNMSCVSVVVVYKKCKYHFPSTLLSLIHHSFDMNYQTVGGGYKTKPYQYCFLSLINGIWSLHYKHTTWAQQPLTWGWSPVCEAHPHVMICCAHVVNL